MTVQEHMQTDELQSQNNALLAVPASEARV
jgi:hypothetical protein